MILVDKVLENRSSKKFKKTSFAYEVGLDGNGGGIRPLEIDLLISGSF